MSLYARLRRKRLRNFKVFMKNAVCIDGIYIFQIHQIPKIIEYGQEFDFWIIDKKDCYMLRIEKSKEQVVYFSRRKWEDPLYCIMKVDFDSLDVMSNLLLLKQIGIPYKMRGHHQDSKQINIYK